MQIRGITPPGCHASRPRLKQVFAWTLAWPLERGGEDSGMGRLLALTAEPPSRVCPAHRLVTESGRITMGLMDKVKAQATVLAEKTQETVRDRKAQVDQAQAKRPGDVLLPHLAAAGSAGRPGPGPARRAAGID